MVLFLRIVSYGGLTWILGFLAAILEHNILWVLFILFNASQGLFVSLSCILTKQVRAYLYHMAHSIMCFDKKDNIYVIDGRTVPGTSSPSTSRTQDFDLK